MDLKKIVILAGVGLASAAVGILLPNVIKAMGTEAIPQRHAERPLPTEDPHAPEKEKSDHEPKKEAGGHGGHYAEAGQGRRQRKKPKEGPQFLPFARMVVNLNEPMLVKFLSIEISVQTDAKYESEVKAALGNAQAGF